MSTPHATPSQKKKNWFARHKIMTALLAVVVLVIVATSIGGGGETSTTTPAATSTSAAAKDAGSSESSQESSGEPADPPADDAPGIGDTVEVGAFEVTVAKVEDGGTQVGDEYLNEKPQGQFVKVFVAVRNTGDASEYFMDSDQKLIDGEDRQHSTSSDSIYLSDKNLFITKINPGNTAEGVLLFDIPTDAEPAAIDLSDASLFGSPVRVHLK